MPKPYQAEVIRAVVAAIVKNTSDGLRILTQRRVVMYKEYDPLYDGTHELVGESIEQGESVLDALHRGFREECGGEADDIVHVAGADGPAKERRMSSRTDDQYRVVNPVLMLETVMGPQPWLGYGFIVEVEPDWEPDHSKSDGEAEAPRWWSQAALQEELHKNPKAFMGLHLPLIEYVSRW